MTCPKCQREVSIFDDKVDCACILVWSKCEDCLSKDK